MGKISFVEISKNNQEKEMNKDKKEYLRHLSKYMKDSQFPKSLKNKIYAIAKKSIAEGKENI